MIQTGVGGRPLSVVQIKDLWCLKSEEELLEG